MAKTKLTTSQNFEHLKNLLFYNGHQPFYFYFNSLINYRSQDPIYNARAEGVAAEGMAALTKGFLDQSQANEKDSMALLQLEMAVNTLQNAIQYERNNEIAYFKQKLALLKANFNPEEIATIAEIRELERMFSNLDNFNYNEFLVLVNGLMQGLNNTKAIVSYENTRLNEIDSAMKKIREVHEHRLIGLTKKMGIHETKKGQDFIQRNMNKFERRIDMTYLDHGNLQGTYTRKRNGKNVTTDIISGVKKYLDPLRGTVEVEVARWLTQQLKDITSDKAIMEELTTFINQWAVQHIADNTNWNAAGDQIKSIIIKSFLDYGAKHIPEILSKTYKQLPIEEITNMLSNSLDSVFSYKITGLYDNIGQFGLTLDLFKNASSITDLENNNAEQLYEALKRLRECISRYKQDSKKNKLTNEQKYFMKAIGTGLEGDEYREIMKLIAALEDIQKKYETALKKNEKIIKPYTTAANKRIKDKNNEEIILTVDLTGGEISPESLKSLKKQIASIKGSDKFIRYASDLSASDLKGIITGLKTRVSHQLKKDIIAAVNKQEQSGKRTGPIINALRDGLQNVYISIGGPSFQELRQTILQNASEDILSNNWTGKINRKNDVVTITIKLDKSAIAKTIAEKVELSAETITQTLNSQSDNIKATYAKEFSDYFYGELSKLNNSVSHEHNSYRKNADIFFDYINKQNTALDQANGELNATAKLWQEYEQSARKAGVKAEDIAKKRNEILNSLQDTFFVSSTMKTYNQYQNDLGFKGGSIGANLIEQLDNMNEIFTAAGLEISADDKNWLLSAIINCSPISIIGERNKNIIENYLGALAAFALFDEGVAELDIIDALNNPSKNIINSSPNILHLYNVNGIFIPGSFVLQQTYEQLQKCLALGSLAIKNQQNQGATVEIYNKMTETGIPNRGKITPGKGQAPSTVLNTDPWGTIGQRAINSVSIKVVFLGGLLDILNKMNNIMNNIQLPSK